jgi:hypothetical protein
MAALRHDSPGPAQFNHKTTLNGPKFSFPRQRAKSEVFLPLSPLQLAEGPSRKGYTFPKQPKEQVPRSHTLGPGTYEMPNQHVAEQWSFGRSPRGQRQGEIAPGPGSYELKPWFQDLPSYVRSKLKHK